MTAVALLPVVAGLLLSVVGLRAFPTPGVLRCVYLTVVAAFVFWYWAPALNLLVIGYIGPDDFTPPRAALHAAVWTVLGYEIAGVAALWLIRPFFAVRRPPADEAAPSAAPVAVAVLISAVAFLTARFAKEGFGVFVNLVIGLSSARDTATYFNQSEDAASSLNGLWEIVNIWLALFVVSDQMRRHRLLSGIGMMGIAAIALIFIGSGTRATLLQTISVIALSAALRPPRAAGVPRPRPWLYLVPLAGVFGILAAGFVSRFREGVGADSSPIVDTLIVNPDMTRELAFVIDQLPNYRNVSPVSFLLTPFAFMLPRFLGFSRGIAEHLNLYNQARGGVDLEFGQGNLFPGVVADFHMVFAAWGPLLFASFIALYAVVLARVAGTIRSGFLGMTFVITCCSYLFFSFRNIAGMLFLVIIFGFAVCSVLTRLPAWRGHRQQRATAGIAPYGS